jgi:hypothetical protein
LSSPGSGDRKLGPKWNDLHNSTTPQDNLIC